LHPKSTSRYCHVMANILAVSAVILSGALLCAGARAEPRPAVFELYTSQGCSSCPPAEAIVAALAERADVLPLSFHVDYWDNQGWHDRFSLPDATRRQHTYASKLHHDSVYTPQGIVDGNTDLVASRSSVVSELSAARDGVGMRAAIDQGFLTVSVAARPGLKSSDVLLIGFLRRARTHIGRGENSGLTIEEFNIVRSIQRLGSWDGDACSFRLALSSLPKDATHAAFLLQIKGQGSIVGAASLPINSKDES
jgi:hypothetical protein